MAITAADYATSEISREQAEELVKKDNLDFNAVVTEHLFDGRVFMRRNAALVSRVSGKVPVDLVNLFAVATKDNDALVREHAMLALAKIDASLDVIAPILLRGLTDRADAVRAAARESLDRVASKRTAELIPHLIAALGDPSPDVQLVAAGLLATPLAVKPLVEALIIPIKSLRDLIGSSLVRLGDEAAGALIAALADPDRRAPAAQVIANLGKVDDKHRKAIEKLTAGDDEPLKQVAIDLLRQLAMGSRPPIEIPAIPIGGWGDRELDARELDAAAGGKVSTDDLVLNLRDGRPWARANAASVLARRAKGDEALEDVFCSELSVLVRDHSAGVRRAAIDALGRVGTALTVGALLTALDDPVPELALAARTHLEKLGPSAASWIIASLSRQQSAVVHGAVVDMLRAYGKPCVPALVAALEQPSPLAREVAATALERMEQNAPEAIPGLIKALSDQSDDVRCAAAWALGSVARRDDAVLSALATAHLRGTIAVREAASQAFARLSPSAAIEIPPIAIAGFEERPLSDKDVGKAAAKIDPAHLMLALGDGRPVVRHNAAVAIGTLGAKGVDATAWLTVLLRDADPPVRRAAARALGHVAGGPDATVAAAGLADAMLDPEVAADAVEALSTLGGSILPALIQALDRDPELAARTASVPIVALGKAAVEPLAGALSHLSVRVRANAAAALATIGKGAAEPAREALSAAAAEDPDSLVRAEARRALDVLDGIEPPPRNLPPEPLPIDGFDREALPIATLRKHAASLELGSLRRLIFDGHPRVRENAARAFQLVARKPDDALSELLITIKDADRDVAIAALESLAALALDPDRVIPALAARLFEGSRVVREAAIATIVSYGKAAVAPLLAMLADPSRRAVPAIFVVVRRMPKELLAPLAAKLGKNEPVVVRENAADVLGELGREAASVLPALLKCVRDEKELTVRVKAIYAVANVATLTADVKKVLDAVNASDRRFEVHAAVSAAIFYLTARSKG